MTRASPGRLRVARLVQEMWAFVFSNASWQRQLLRTQRNVLRAILISMSGDLHVFSTRACAVLDVFVEALALIVTSNEVLGAIPKDLTPDRRWVFSR